MRERGGVMRLYRCANNLHKKHIPFIPKVISRIIRIVFSADIPYQTEIGIGTQLAHNGLGVVINQDSRIGKNCKILQNVTIGGRGEGNGVPIIEDNVLIGAGAAILGGVKIGRGAKIGANAVVVKDVPENATVVGIPAKII